MVELILLSFHPDSEVDLDLSNNAIGPVGGNIIGKISYKLNNIKTLNLNDTSLGDDGISDLCKGFLNNYTIKRLYLNRNFKNATKHRASAIQNLIKLISSESAVNVLHLAAAKGYPLKQDLVSFVSAIGSTSKLIELDISGHQMGNKGAIALAKALQTDTSLTTLHFDENLTGLMGFRNIKYSLELNKSLKYITLPLSDIGTLLNDLGDMEQQRKLQKMISKIEKRLQINQLQKK